MKALVGAHVDQRTFRLLEEVRALRARVAQLEFALEEAESALRSSDAHTVLDLDVEEELDTASIA